MKKVILFFALIFILSAQDLKAQDYQTAVGLRAGWGLSATGKHFISESNALEAIVNFRSILGISFIRVSGLFEVHNDLSSVTEGLQWYFGGGGTMSFAGGGGIGNNTAFGLIGTLGLDYKFPTAPINISVDWLPIIGFSSGSGFAADNGGIAVRYTF